MDLTIEHQPAHKRFVAIVEGRDCVIDYHLGHGVMTITHTGVPPALEGRGIAAQLTQFVFDYARTNQLKIRPACSYSRSYMERHPDTRDLLA